MNYRSTSSSSPGTGNSTRTANPPPHLHDTRGHTYSPPWHFALEDISGRNEFHPPPETLEGKNGTSKAARSAIPRNRGNLNEISPVGRHFSARNEKAQYPRKVSRKRVAECNDKLAARWLFGYFLIRGASCGIRMYDDCLHEVCLGFEESKYECFI